MNVISCTTVAEICKFSLPVNYEMLNLAKTNPPMVGGGAEPTRHVSLSAILKRRGGRMDNIKENCIFLEVLQKDMGN
jgi:hypothetical protein